MTKNHYILIIEEDEEKKFFFSISRRLFVKYDTSLQLDQIIEKLLSQLNLINVKAQIFIPNISLANFY